MGLLKEVAVGGETTYLFPDAMLYSQYSMKYPEKVLLFVIGFIVGCGLGMVFYGLLPVAAIFGVIVGLGIIPLRRNQIIAKQIRTLKLQFKDMLESVSTSIGAGRNINDAFTYAHKDMVEQFSEEAYIAKETANIISGIHNNINIEDLLMDMAARSGVDDIKIFAEVFDTCYRKGGDIKEVITSTHKVINDKMEIEMEIQTMITSAKAELNMMCAMPVVFVFILNSLGGNITGRGTVSGYIATTVALGIFVAAYFVGRKIMTVRM